MTIDTAVLGLHHITAISGSAQENLDFYNRVLGLRLVKKSVNQDDPGTYHLFYADDKGSPGTDLTFFPWTHMPKGRKGIGLTSEVQMAVPAGSLGYWQKRLNEYGVHIDDPTTRFGERVLGFRDPHGMDLSLVETEDERPFQAWSDSPVPENHQIRGLHGARLWERDLGATETFLISVLGLAKLASEDGWHRYGLANTWGGVGSSGNLIDIKALPDGRRGEWGIGTVHHIAWRVKDKAHQLAVRERVAQAGRRPTDIIDRFWFKSVYFMEPGGVLFELATDGPGFAVDEAPDKLGEKLILPPWLEPQREQIEARLPDLQASSRDLK